MRTPGLTSASAPLADALLERANAHVRPFENAPGVIGAFLFGSASRPYADTSSDVDVEVILDHEPEKDGAYRRTSAGIARIVDVRLTSRATLEQRLARYGDGNRWKSAKSIILFDDAAGTLAGINARAAIVPEERRQLRMRIHYAEIMTLEEELARDRNGDPAAARLRAAELVSAASKLLSFASHEWPCPTQWIWEELSLLGIPDEITSAMRALLDAPAPGLARGVLDGIRSFLDLRGIAIERSPASVWATPLDLSRARWDWGGNRTRLG
jgi:predicted nucleotidyltransferase